MIVQKQVFESQCIHGIKAQATSETQDDLVSSLILIWGGRSVALVKFFFSCPERNSDIANPRIIIGPEVKVSDWVLDLDFAVLSSPHPDVAYLVTAHNCVFTLWSESPNYPDFNVSLIASGFKSILYSANIKPISDSTILVAAGTVLGDVVLWRCYRTLQNTAEDKWRWVTHLCRVFHGHNGSIFGVCLSDPVRLSPHHSPQQYLASCSDDRTIRVWNVSGCHELPAHPLTSMTALPEPRSPTCQEVANPASLAVAWAHLSRIWGVTFLSSACSPESCLIASRGEDAACQLWELRLGDLAASIDDSDPGSGSLQFRQACGDRFHSGKHIWALAYHYHDIAPTIFTGGSDGAIIRRLFHVHPNRNAYQENRMPFIDILEHLEPQAIAKTCSQKPSHDSIKQYVFVTDHTILAITNSGRIIQGVFRCDTHDHNRSSVQWSLILHAPEFGGLAVMASDTTQRSVYFGSAVGTIWLYRLGGRPVPFLADIGFRILNIFVGPLTVEDCGLAFQNLLVCSTIPSVARLLHISQDIHQHDNVRVLKAIQLNLPSNFQPAAFLDISCDKRLVLGSRFGALAVFQDVLQHSSINDSICVRHVHQSDMVTCLQHLRTSKNNEDGSYYHDLLSTGRDGTFSIHRLSSDWSRNKGSTTTLRTLHRSFPPFGPFIEGARVASMVLGVADVLLFGFNGKNFVVWNESSGREVMSVFCGGAHRSWAFESQHANLGYNTLSYKGHFVWTKAGVFNLAKCNAPSHSALQRGGHGREIKSVALFIERICNDASTAPLNFVVATGAEDTDIRLWHMTPSKPSVEDGALVVNHADVPSCTNVLKKHTTGIQHMVFCQNYLFSSSGFEELFIWKLNFDVSGVRIGVVCQAKLPKHEAVSDLRITSFEVIHDVRDMKGGLVQDAEIFLIYAAYSNSMVRIFQYNDNDLQAQENRFHLLGEGYYSSICLTHLCRMPEGCPWFFTASTNGAVAIWPEIRKLTQHQTPDALSHVSDFSIHQSAILAMCVIEIESKYHLILTGGDDNAFGISLIYCPRPGDEGSSPLRSGNAHTLPQFGTLLISKAHTAAVTALGILDIERKHRMAVLTVVSVGNDQLVKIWRITVDLDELSRLAQDGVVNVDSAFRPAAANTISVHLLKQIWSNVADASSVITIPDEANIIPAAKPQSLEAGKGHHGHRILVAGIGMEMLWIDAGCYQG